MNTKMKKKIVRNRQIKIRLSEDEFNCLNEKVVRSGLSREAYIRMIINGLVPKDKPAEEYLEILRQLRMIGNNINQLAVVAHKTGSIDGLKIKELSEKIRYEIVEIKKIADKPAKIGCDSNGSNGNMGC